MRVRGRGATLRALRERRGHDLRSLAGDARVSPSYLSELERGVKTNPRPPVLKRLADALGVSVEDLTATDDEGAA